MHLLKSKLFYTELDDAIENLIYILKLKKNATFLGLLHNEKTRRFKYVFERFFLMKINHSKYLSS